VSIVGGDSFGAPNCVRFSYATSDEKLVEAIKRIKNSLQNLK
jgi:aspartate aminotransferase